jgi:hypothetical protein
MCVFYLLHDDYAYMDLYIYIQYTHIYIHNVGKTIINHPPVITINRWYKPFSNGVVYGVLPT